MFPLSIVREDRKGRQNNDEEKDKEMFTHLQRPQLPFQRNEVGGWKSEFV